MKRQPSSVVSSSEVSRQLNNTAYDHVVTVSNNIDSIIALAQNINAGSGGNTNTGTASEDYSKRFRFNNLPGEMYSPEVTKITTIGDTNGSLHGKRFKFYVNYYGGDGVVNRDEREIFIFVNGHSTDGWDWLSSRITIDENATAEEVAEELAVYLNYTGVETPFLEGNHVYFTTKLLEVEAV
jgi:hypothetical protein